MIYAAVSGSFYKNIVTVLWFPVIKNNDNKWQEKYTKKYKKDKMNQFGIGNFQTGRASNYDTRD